MIGFSVCSLGAAVWLLPSVDLWVVGVPGLLVVAAEICRTDWYRRRIHDRDVVGLVAFLVLLLQSAGADGEAVLVGGAVLGFIGMLLHAGPELFGVRGLGFGDVKLMAAIGMGTGWEVAGEVLLVAQALALVIAVTTRRRRPFWRRSVPFGPCLLLAGAAAVAVAGAA